MRPQLLQTDADLHGDMPTSTITTKPAADAVRLVQIASGQGKLERNLRGWVGSPRQGSRVDPVAEGPLRDDDEEKPWQGGKSRQLSPGKSAELVIVETTPLSSKAMVGNVAG